MWARSGRKRKGKKLRLTEMFAGDKRRCLSTGARGGGRDLPRRELQCVGSIWPRSLARVMQC